MNITNLHIMPVKIKIRDNSCPKGAARRALFTVLFLSAIFLIAGCNGSEQKEATAGVVCDPDNGGITLPDGFYATVVIDSLGLRDDHSARHIAVADNGDIYMKTRSQEGGIVALRDTNGDYKADIIKFFGNMNETKEGILWESGIAIHNGYLWASNTTAVYRWPMPKDGELVPKGQPEMVVSGFPEQQSHRSKSFTFDNRGNLYVAVGAPSNAKQARFSALRPVMPPACAMLLGLIGIAPQMHSS